VVDIPVLKCSLRLITIHQMTPIDQEKTMVKYSTTIIWYYEYCFCWI